MSLEKYKYVLEYNRTKFVSDKLVQSLLHKAWKVTPSKNNFMPYSVLVVDQNSQELKDAIYKLCLKGESLSTSIPDIESVRYQTSKPQYYNVVSCSYLLIFVRRPVVTLNEWQQYNLTQGNTYRQVSGDSDESVMEMGIFSTAFASLCLQFKLDISHTMCFSKEKADWTSLGLGNFTHAPTMLLTVGKGLKYRQDEDLNLRKVDLKPNFSEIVKFVS